MDQSSFRSNLSNHLPLLAWIFVGIVCLAAPIYIAVTAASLEGNGIIEVIGIAAWMLLAVVSTLVAALIISRQPQNRIGWLLIAPPLIFVLSLPVDVYMSRYSSTPPPPTVPVLLMVWFQNWSWLVLIFPILLILLLFPTGMPPSPRWRWLQYAAVGMFALFILVDGFGENLHSMDDAWVVTNPIGWIPDDPFIFVYFIPAWIVSLGLLTILCGASLIVRYRRASHTERIQIKWLLYTGSLFVLFYVPLLALGGESQDLLVQITDLFLAFSILLFPITIAIAILRHRLWDIDVIIRRTLIYSILTALLALVFFGSIVVLQQIVGSFTGTQDSPFVIVLSTLGIAALFTPLHRAIQDVIDRRFYRKNYDAHQFLQRFSTTTRYEVEVEQLAAHLMSAVEETLQPESVNLWLLSARKKE